MFMVTSVSYLPPSEDHPKDINIFKVLYVVIIVYVIICFFAPFTGAHINPAVTVAVLERKKKCGNLKLILSYWVGQFLGGLVGVLISRNIYGNGGAAFEVAPDGVELGKICL